MHLIINEYHQPLGIRRSGVGCPSGIIDGGAIDIEDWGNNILPVIHWLLNCQSVHVHMNDLSRYLLFGNCRSSFQTTFSFKLA